MSAEPQECVPERPAGRPRVRWREWMPLTLLAGAVLVGAALWLAGRRGPADAVWAAATVVALVPAVWAVLRQLWQRRFGVDVIAVLALAGALVGRRVPGRRGDRGDAGDRPGAGGDAPAARAPGTCARCWSGRPRTARRRTADGGVEMPVDGSPSGTVLVGPGEVVPVDGRRRGRRRCWTSRR